MNRRNFSKSALAALALTSLAHANNAQAVNVSVVNKSARVRALSQRLVKLKAQQLLQISPESTSDSLIASEKILASHMAFLVSSVPPAAKKQLEALRASVTLLMSQVAVTATKDSLTLANKTSLLTLAAADDLTTAMQSMAKEKSADIVNMAGRERMLSQRLAKNFFLMAAKIEGSDVGAKIDADRALFSESLKKLSSNTVADAKIKQEISVLAGRFKKYDELLADKSEKAMGKAHLSNVATLSEQVLASAHEVTGLFEDLLKVKEAA
jgi:Type IV pili methyl-accepting chemotaxis transducer N-term